MTDEFERETAERAAEAVSQAAETAAENAAEAMSQAAEAAAEQVAEAAEAAGHAVETAGEALTETFAQAAEEQAQALSEGAQSLTEEAAQAAAQTDGEPESPATGLEENDSARESGAFPEPESIFSGAPLPEKPGEEAAPAEPYRPDAAQQPGYPQPQVPTQPYPAQGCAPGHAQGVPPGYGTYPGGQPYYGGWPAYGYAPPVQQKQKKKASTGVKVFGIVACLMAAVAIGGFAGYLIWGGSGTPVTVQDSFGDYFGGELPFELPDGRGGGDEDSRPQLPEDRDDNGAGRGEDKQTPDFGAKRPDADEPLPEVDVTPNEEGISIEKRPTGQTLTPQEVYEKVVKSTVTVAVTREVGGTTQSGTGTGIIATSDGYIITNSHVVLNSKSSRVKITTYDGQEYDAVVVGTDRTTDLAVLKTNDYNFSPAEFGDSDQLVIGEQVIAIGNPGGAKFSGSMTGGYVSGLNREVSSYSANGMTFIQTDAAINPGNSGGPLVNMYGQVVGINSSKIVYTGYEGMGFAIPVTKGQVIINELMAGGYIKGRVRLGISGMDVADAVSNGYYYLMGYQGFVIAEINTDSAFAGTEAQAGDIITALDGETVTGLTDISNLLLKYSPGDTVTVTLTRIGNGGTETLEVQATLLEDKGETQK